MPLFFGTTFFAAQQNGRAGGRQSDGRRLAFQALEPRQVLNGGGLVGQYFFNPDFTGLAADRTEAVDFAWGNAAPAPGVNGDSFSVRWTGQVEAKYSETYTFRTVSADPVRLWVDGDLLIDAWTPHAARVDSGVIALTAGKLYDVRLEYFESSGLSQMRLQWSSPSQPLEAIPATHLYAPPEGIWGEYSDSSGGQARRLDSQIDFDWNNFSPALNVASDNFRVRWTGYLRPGFSEEYTFSTLSDDGVRVWIGGELVIDHWTPHEPATATGTKTLEAGKWYDLRVEYFEGTGNAEIELLWSSERQTGAGVFEVIGAPHLRAGKHTPLVFTNPLGQGQDPWVIRWQDSYLHVRSSGNSVWIDQADQLQNLHRTNPNSTSVRAWTAPPGTAYSTMIWAPELHQLDGKWYIYVAAAANNDNDTHRMYVLERDDPDPMGTYEFKGKIAATPDRWAIDGTVLEWQGQRYFVWSGWPGTTNGVQNLYIAEMSNPWTITGNRARIATPDYAWEMHGLAINEGPQVLIHEGQLHIIYSASGYWTWEYALGRLTYDGTGSLLDDDNWVKAPSPVFQQSGEVVGVGHASFTVSPDGTENWIVYHAHPSPGGNPDARVVRIQPFTFTAAGAPNFGVPLPPSTQIEVPSGNAAADRELVKGDFDANGAVNAADLDVLIAQFGQKVFPGSASDANGNGLVDAADITIWADRINAALAPLASESAPSLAVEPVAAPAPAELPPTTPSTPGFSAEIAPAIAGAGSPLVGAARPAYRPTVAGAVLADAALAKWPDEQTPRVDEGVASALESTLAPLALPAGRPAHRPALRLDEYAPALAAAIADQMPATRLMPARRR